MTLSISRKNLFYNLLRIRLIEESIAKRYKDQKMRCPVHLSVGQEAIAVGICACLSNEDSIISTHRAHAHYLAKGGSLKSMLAEIHGKSTGCTAGKGGSMHLIDLKVGMKGCTPIVGGSLPIALGIAFANLMKKNNLVTVVFFGEGMTEEGVFSECLNFAALKQLPILFVCENNLYSVYSPLNVRQPKNRALDLIVKGHGVEAQTGNGNDLNEVLKLSKHAIEKIKKGEGPQFIELSTYRWLEHCGPNYDNHIGYRSEEEYLAWEKKCPVENYKTYLMTESEITDHEVKKVYETIQKEIDEAFEYALSSPWPVYNETKEKLYAEKEEECHAAT